MRVARPTPTTRRSLRPSPAVVQPTPACQPVAPPRPPTLAPYTITRMADITIARLIVYPIKVRPHAFLGLGHLGSPGKLRTSTLTLCPSYRCPLRPSFRQSCKGIELASSHCTPDGLEVRPLPSSLSPSARAKLPASQLTDARRTARPPHAARPPMDGRRRRLAQGLHRPPVPSGALFLLCLPALPGLSWPDRQLTSELLARTRPSRWS